MRSFLFLLSSFLIHIFVIVYAVLPIDVILKTQLNNNEFTVKLIRESLKTVVENAPQAESNTQSSVDNYISLNDFKHHKAIMPSHHTPPSLNLETDNQIIARDPAKKQAKTTNRPQAININQAQYYAASQVDRRAMPQLSIDSTSLNNELSSGLPIKLRLYVNTFGHLVKIERVGVLDQDIPFVEQLEKQLYAVSFLPARLDGVDVDSYMEVEFSFNPLAPLDN